MAFLGRRKPRQPHKPLLGPWVVSKAVESFCRGCECRGDIELRTSRPRVALPSNEEGRARPSQVFQGVNLAPKEVAVTSKGITGAKEQKG